MHRRLQALYTAGVTCVSMRDPFFLISVDYFLHTRIKVICEVFFLMKS